MHGQPLRDVEARVLHIIKTHLEENEYPPSVRDIQGKARLSSTSYANYLLEALVRKGYIRRIPDISRGIEIVDDESEACAPSLLRVPLIGTISAGTGILANPEPEDCFAASDTAPGAAYALRVKGVSMTGDNIADGDTVMVKPQTYAEPGDIAVVLMLSEDGITEDEVTLKRIASRPMAMPDGTVKIKLKASNEANGYSFFTDAGRLRIQGKVVGVIRKLA